MKKLNRKFVAGTAFALGAAASLTGCRCILPMPAVYGPAPSAEIETSEEAVTEYETTTEIPVPLYGPPEMFEPDTEVVPTVYGPPDAFDPEDEVQEDVYGPPEYFDPELEVQEDVYGPPEWFD